MDQTSQQLSEEQFNRLKVIVSAYKHVFSTPEGKLVLEDMERTHFFNSSTFNPKVDNFIYVAEGERNVVLRIKSLMARDLALMEERMKYAQKPTLVT
jgi:hypothetical protein